MKAPLKKFNDKSVELGFGGKPSNKDHRSLNKDGTFNIKRTGMSFFQEDNIYHDLINMSWKHFTLMVLGIYTVVNFLFAITYYLMGVDKLIGVIANSEAQKFWEAFFFSAQTLTTVGYGRVSPMAFSTNIIASMESFTGLMGFALATGLLYGRFSRPNAKILSSDNAVVAPYKNGTATALMFRIANARKNQLIEAEARVLMSWSAEDDSGKKIRRFTPIDLEIDKISFLALNWTIVHPINEKSPLWGLSEKELLEIDAEFLIMIKAFDDTFSQTVHTRTSYKGHEVVWGARYTPMYVNDGSTTTVLELDKIGSYERVDLPNPSVIMSQIQAE